MIGTVGVTRKAEATILSGAATSDAVDKKGYASVGIIVPSTFDGTSVTFTVCDTVNGTYMPLESTAGTAISYTTNASSAISLVTELAPWPFFKIVASGNQTTTNTVLTVVMQG